MWQTTCSSCAMNLTWIWAGIWGHKVLSPKQIRIVIWLVPIWRKQLLPVKWKEQLRLEKLQKICCGNLFLHGRGGNRWFITIMKRSVSFFSTKTRNLRKRHYCIFTNWWLIGHWMIAMMKVDSVQTIMWSLKTGLLTKQFTLRPIAARLRDWLTAYVDFLMMMILMVYSFIPLLRES